MDVHPLADIFPMMGDDELAELADDIKENGLLHPIVVDADGVLIDGRNRLRACEIAGVEPTFTQLNGHDASAFIVSANLNRRNMKAGQRAMALAMIYPEANYGGARTRGAVSETKTELAKAKVSNTRLSQARSVLRHSRALADDVVAGRIGLDKALERVETEQQASMTVGEQLATLRAMDPDLADLVDEERMTLEDAWTLHEKRIAEAAKIRANQRENITRVSEGLWSCSIAWANTEFVGRFWDEWQDEEFRRQWFARVRLKPELFPDIIAGAKTFAEFVSKLAEETNDE